MADRDDEATAADRAGRVDRDGGGRSDLVDSDDGPARNPGKSPVAAGDSGPLVDRDDEEQAPASWPDAGVPPARTPPPASAPDPGLDLPPWSGEDERDSVEDPGPGEAWASAETRDPGDDWEDEDDWEPIDPDAAGTAPPPFEDAPDDPPRAGRDDADWEEEAFETPWDEPSAPLESTPLESTPPEAAPPEAAPPEAAPPDEDAFNRAVARELREHPYLGDDDDDDDEWAMAPPEEPSTAPADPGGEEPLQAPAGPPPPPPEKDDEAATGRRWPIASLAVGAIALALLVLGGFGVLRERSALQAEVRDLQAELARLPNAAEAREDRDAARSLRARVESLDAELASVRSDYARAEAELAETRDRLARSAEALAAAQAEAETAKAAATAAARRPAPAASRTAGAAGDGDWFVNFGTYAKRSDAASRASGLEVDKGRVVIQDARSEGRTLYRVRVVGLADRDAAEGVARALEARYGLARLWVGREND